MMGDSYFDRTKSECGKGDKKRPPNQEHMHPYLRNQMDLGCTGCKRGFHFFALDEGNRCTYCKKTKEELKEDGLND
jgi:hypothetical protein